MSEPFLTRAEADEVIESIGTEIAEMLASFGDLDLTEDVLCDVEAQVEAICGHDAQASSPEPHTLVVSTTIAGTPMTFILEPCDADGYGPRPTIH